MFTIFVNIHLRELSSKTNIIINILCLIEDLYQNSKLLSKIFKTHFKCGLYFQFRINIISSYRETPVSM